MIGGLLVNADQHYRIIPSEGGTGQIRSQKLEVYRFQTTQKDVPVPVHASWNQSISHKMAELFNVGFPEKN